MPVATTAGAGQPIATLTEHDIQLFSKLTFAAQLVYALALGFSKMSIVWTLRRVFDVASFRHVCYAS